MPLIRRLPKRGFNNAAFRRHYAIVNLDDLNEFKAGATVNEQLLRKSNLVRGHFVGIKILGGGQLKHGLTVEADKVSAAAREKIEKAGGTITLRLRDDGRTSKTTAPDEDVDLATEKVSRKPSARKRSTKRTRPKTKAQEKRKASRKS